MALLETVNIGGTHGRNYVFKVYPITEECPNESGVYAFTKRHIEPLHTVIYIGIAASFQSRFYNHHKGDCIDQRGANRICLLKVDNEAERQRIEKELIGVHNPPCNEVHRTT